MNKNFVTYTRISNQCSKKITQAYSTSFSLGILMLHKKFRTPVHGIYGFVRLADEIVDSFHAFDKKSLLHRFMEDTYLAIEQGISVNPVLNSFQMAVNQYGIPRHLIEQFFYSMEMDLHKKSYETKDYQLYIYGSAEAVGLMCLHVFTENNRQQFEALKPYAMKLGSAFQKINFLRDLCEDYKQLGRTYIPGLDVDDFNVRSKSKIESEIAAEFAEALEGIRRLPSGARFGVYVAWMYYHALFQKIKSLPPSKILNERIRIPDAKKYSLIIKSYFRHTLNLL